MEIGIHKDPESTFKGNGNSYKDDKKGIGTVQVRREKAQVDYVTFVSPEATQALNACIEERNRDKQTKAEGNNDYVFVT